MANNVGVLLATDMQALPDSVEQWAIKNYEDKLSGGASLQVAKNILESSKLFSNHGAVCKVSRPLLPRCA